MTNSCAPENGTASIPKAEERLVCEQKLKQYLKNLCSRMSLDQVEYTIRMRERDLLRISRPHNISVCFSRVDSRAAIANGLICGGASMRSVPLSNPSTVKIWMRA